MVWAHRGGGEKEGRIMGESGMRAPGPRAGTPKLPNAVPLECPVPHIVITPPTLKITFVVTS